MILELINMIEHIAHLSIHKVFTPSSSTIDTLFKLLLTFLNSYQVNMKLSDIELRKIVDPRKGLLQTMTSLVPSVQEPQWIIVPLSHYLLPNKNQICDPVCRNEVINILNEIGKKYTEDPLFNDVYHASILLFEQAIYELKELNSYSSSRIDDYDYGRRGDAYNRIAAKRMIYSCKNS